MLVKMYVNRTMALMAGGMTRQAALSRVPALWRSRVEAELLRGAE